MGTPNDDVIARGSGAGPLVFRQGLQVVPSLAVFAAFASARENYKKAATRRKSFPSTNVFWYSLN